MSTLIVDKFWDATSFEDGNTSDMPITTNGAPLLNETYNPSRIWRRFSTGVDKNISGKFYLPATANTMRFRFHSRLYDLTQSGITDTDNIVIVISTRFAPTYPSWNSTSYVSTHPVMPTQYGWGEWYIDYPVSAYSGFGQFSIVRNGTDTRDQNALEWDLMCMNWELYS